MRRIATLFLRFRERRLDKSVESPRRKNTTESGGQKASGANDHEYFSDFSADVRSRKATRPFGSVILKELSSELTFLRVVKNRRSRVVFHFFFPFPINTTGLLVCKAQTISPEFTGRIVFSERFFFYLLSRFHRSRAL